MILITGSRGQLGQSIQKISTQFFNKEEFLFLDVKELDITDELSINLFLKENHIDWIINCAAYTAVDLAESDRTKCEQVNTLAPKLLGELSFKNNIRIIHISTDYVFSGEHNIPYVEDDLPDPKSIYGKTKLMGEIELLNANPNAIIIRTAWLYSEFEKNFLHTMIKLGLEKKEIQVVFDQIGTPTYATDLARSILQIIEMQKDAKTSAGIYHFSNEGVASWYDFAIEIFRLYDIDNTEITCKINPVRASNFKTIAPRPSYSVLDKTKIKEMFKIQIPHWSDSLMDALVAIEIRNEIKY